MTVCVSVAGGARTALMSEYLFPDRLTIKTAADDAGWVVSLVPFQLQLEP